MKEEGRRKKEVLRWGLEPQFKTSDPENGRGINKNSEDKKCKTETRWFPKCLGLKNISDKPPKSTNSGEL
ncbi:MAG: hypothetical protein KME60_29205 [Cyanomargarita calcarea GSE-NOS-MK-12-04C]|jgi:hypothetical protein|uniref:Uncharacterized protein n=1 Tax=Cyanomargarita calcarea GSE-NOS-MK-12-04C TaxID=2839659 RepID=A0A951QSM7_9CYAN|nr:hypothetical protein [Cyanomargarita calcarea GSE-NOS-MK-12-04C]